MKEDEIFKLYERFKNDKRKNKINSAIGVYLDEKGDPYIPQSVKKAIKKIDTKNFNYLPISGNELFLKECSHLVFGSRNIKNIAKQGVIGGTNGLFMWGNFIKYFDNKPAIILGIPTWENHKKIFSYLKFRIIIYKHLLNNQFDIDGFKKIIHANRKATILFHGGPTHNPTGINPTKKEWFVLAELIKKTKHKVLFDFAYCGLGENIDRDAFPIRLFIHKGIPVSVVFSLSKNMSLYQHRTGALFIQTRGRGEKLMTEKILQNIFRVVNSNPSAFGENIAAIVLSDPNLKKQWVEDISSMTKSLKSRRVLFAKKTKGRFDYVTKGMGLFSLLELNTKQIEVLRKRYAIYLLPDGRINFGGLSKKNLTYVAKSILKVAT